jgi:acetyl esterase/lipase
MVMARRPGVKTAPAPVVAIDSILLAQQMAAALARLPFRRPLAGGSVRPSNLGTAVAREAIRSFMGYMTSLPIPEFRSMELLLDDLCGVVMPPLVRWFDVTGRQTDFGGIPGILYWPRHGTPSGVVLYLHGGGYIGTSPTMYAFFTARLCRETGCAVFVADYRLAPEFPFPAGVEDAAAVSHALVERGIPPERLFIAGDSGGGGLANTLLVAAPAHVGVVRPAGLILFSPEVDLRLDEDSVTGNAEYDVLPWNIPTASYLHGVDASSAYVSPVNADLKGFPPTCMSWGADEMFRDPIRRFADRLRQAGVPIHAHEAPGMFHVFPILMPWAEASREVYQHVGRFVHGILEDAPALDGGTFNALCT